DAALGTVRLALEAARDAGDAAAMAEFCLRHAEQVQALRRQSPLAALRARSLERARRLADRAHPPPRVRWYLLLAWERDTQGRREEVQELGSRLLKIEVPCMWDWMRNCEVELLAQTIKVWADRAPDLAEKLLDSESRSMLIPTLAGMGCLTEALQ